MKKFLLISLGLALLFAAGWGVARLLHGSGVAVVHPVKGTAVQAVYATGTVEATIMLPIAPRVGARLMELKADEGSEVSKGQLLAQLEDEDLRHNVQQLQARETYARKAYERASKLLKSGAIAKKTYDEALADWQAAVAATRETQVQAGYLGLHAPADGQIIKRDGEIGQMMIAGEPLFWMAVKAPLRISAEVDEEDIALVRAKQAVLIRSDAFTGQVFHGRVQAVTPKGDPVTRSYRVRIELTEPTPLQIGMTTETNIVISEHPDALLVPSSAVVDAAVWLVEKGRLRRHKVGVGAKGPQQTEIKNGVTTQSLVVLKPENTLKEGQPVRAVLQTVP